MRKRLCACGCGDRVTKKVEAQHMNVLTPGLLASQVLAQNRRSIQRKKRSEAIGFPAPFRRRLAMDDPVDNGPSGLSNTPDLSTMMGEDPVEVHGQSRLSDSGDHVKKSKFFQISIQLKMLILIMQSATIIPSYLLMILIQIILAHLVLAILSLLILLQWWAKILMNGRVGHG